jgi:hypothetical protein
MIRRFGCCQFSDGQSEMTPPLFLLAPPRSYTSVVNAMIGQHPQLYGFPELNLFNGAKLKELWIRVSDDLGDDSNRRNGLLRAVAQIYGGEQTSETIGMALHWAAARQEQDTGKIYQELVAKIAPLMSVDKSPAYTLSGVRLMRILKAFPEARFIHLVRHPIPQCKSVMNLNEGVFALLVNAIDFEEDRATVDPQIAWHDINVNILNFLNRVPKERQMRLRGEDLMAKPEQHLAEICRWLGVSTSTSCIEEMLRPERSPYACFGPITALFGNDPNFLRRPAFRRHIPELPDLHAKLPWRLDGRGLRPEVVQLAIEFGYR